MKNLILFTFVLSLSVCKLSYGQPDPSCTTKISAVNAYLSIGYLQQNYEPLNEYFLNHGTPGFKNEGINVGFGGSVFFKRMVYGGEGDVLLNNKVVSNSLKSEIKTGSASVYLGYIIKESTNSLLYPSLGFGIRGTEFEVKAKNTQETEISNQISLTSTQLFTKLALNTDFFLNRQSDDRGGVTVGLTVGYKLKLPGLEWSKTNAKAKKEILNRFGSLDKRGVYFAIKLGWGVI